MCELLREHTISLGSHLFPRSLIIESPFLGLMLMTSQSRLGAFSPVVGCSQDITCSLVKARMNILHGPILCSVLIIVSNVDKAIEVNGCWIISFIGD